MGGLNHQRSFRHGPTRCLSALSRAGKVKLLHACGTFWASNWKRQVCSHRPQQCGPRRSLERQTLWGDSAVHILCFARKQLWPTPGVTVWARKRSKGQTVYQQRTLVVVHCPGRYICCKKHHNIRRPQSRMQSPNACLNLCSDHLRSKPRVIYFTKMNGDTRWHSSWSMVGPMVMLICSRTRAWSRTDTSTFPSTITFRTGGQDGSNTLDHRRRSLGPVEREGDTEREREREIDRQI